MQSEGKAVSKHKVRTECLPVDPTLMTPELSALFNHWTDLRQGERWPHWGGAVGPGFSLVGIPAALLPIMVIVDVDLGENTFIYRYWGSARKIFLGSRPDPTGTSVIAGLPVFSAENVLSQYRDVCRDGKPVLLSNLWPLDNGLTAECQTLRLPLTVDGRTVGKIASATVFLRHGEEFRKQREKTE